MGFVEAVKLSFQRIVDFQGRSSRPEYWWFVLFYMILYVGLVVLSSISSIFVAIVGLFSIVMILPSLSVSIRRLHDLDKSGWWILISIIPLIGTILLIYWFCLRGTDGDNRFGPDPLGNVADRFD